MNRRAFLKGAGSAGLALLGARAIVDAAEAPARRPNVLFLLADDLGWGDISCHGGSIPTPNIDRLFATGVRLPQYTAWTVCSPTRAMFLTGRHPFRVGTGPQTGGELEAGETTIAEGFKAQGYRTGVFGKWHNGDDPDTPEYRRAFEEAWKSMPNKKLTGGLGANAHGFDEAWVYYGGGADYFTRRTVQNRGPVSWWHNREFRPQDEGYTEDLITRHALEFLRASRGGPFFCYVPFHIVHAPLQAKPDDLARAPAGDETKRVYHAMVRSLDDNVGQIVAELERQGLRENTILVFSSDNGATQNGSNFPLRGGKHTLWDGGVRLPTVLSWPGGGLRSGRDWNGLCSAMDMFPTLMAMAGLPMPPTRPLDGKNLWPAIRDNGPSPVESCYWCWHDSDAIRTSQWKMHRYFDHFELYDIRKDEGEATNVADAHPEVVRELTGKMDAWVGSLGAALTHQPAPKLLDAPPAPEGEVLEISVTIAPEAKPKDRLVIPFASWGGSQVATDYLEFDICVAPGGPDQGFFYTPFKGNEAKAYQFDFRRGVGIDQFGREQAAGPAPRGGAGVWEHRVVGLCGSAPGALPRHALVFNGGRPGTCKVYLDNVRIRRADGTTSPIWTGASDTRFPRQQVDGGALFTNISVRAVPLADVPTR